MTPVYPPTLPGVSGFQFTPTPQLAVSDIDRSARATRRITQVPGAHANLTWKFNNTQYQEFMDWWRDQLLDGHRWFSIPLPSAAGIQPTVVRFLNHRETQVDGYKFWIVTGLVEIRERRIRPDLIDDYLTSTIYPIYVPEELAPIIVARNSQLSPPVEVLEQLEPIIVALTSTLVEKLKTVSLTESIEPEILALSGTLKVVLHTTELTENIKPTTVPRESELKRILVVNEVQPEGLASTITALSGQLI